MVIAIIILSVLLVAALGFIGRILWGLMHIMDGF